MRLWSLHPKYLDAKGMVALWREALLARKVLAGKTRGYRRHPQLERFRMQEDPEGALNAYLREVFRESIRRGYVFDRSKVRGIRSKKRIPVTRGQLRYEFERLCGKLRKRDRRRYRKIRGLRRIQPHPFLKTVAGGVEKWEKSG